MRSILNSYLLLLCFLSCNPTNDNITDKTVANNTYNKIIGYPKPDSAGYITKIDVGKTKPADVVLFAQSLIGIPYKYASTDPSQGFDCSGFITHVFNHFGILVPRSSIDFAPIHHPIRVESARPGDLILFTGTDSAIRKVGHMGIIVSSPGHEIKFIHSTSGKADGVTETPLNQYYRGRYMSTIRIFPQNER